MPEAGGISLFPVAADCTRSSRWLSQTELADIWIDPDQVSIEGGMVDLGQRQAVRDDRLP
jgi:hypothetical protein